MRFPMILAASLVAASLLSQGCTAETSEVEEAALTSSKTLAKGVAYPSALAVVDGYVYFGSNKLIASGNIELDQANAYWTGKFSRVPVGGGRAEFITDVGPIANVRATADGTRIFYNKSDACSVSSIDPRRPGTVKTVYDAADCDGDVDGPGLVSGFDVAGPELVITRADGKILKGNLDGSGMRQLAEIRIGNWGNIVDSQVVADGDLYVTTMSLPPAVPAALYRVALGTGRTNKIAEFATSPRHLISDGTNVYYTLDGTRVMGIGARRPPTVVAEGLGQVIDLAAHGTNLFIADAKRGSVYIVKNATTAPAKPKKLAAVKGIYALTATSTAVYFGSHVVENNKFAGILGSIALP